MAADVRPPPSDSDQPDPQREAANGSSGSPGLAADLPLAADLAYAVLAALILALLPPLAAAGMLGLLALLWARRARTSRPRVAWPLLTGLLVTIGLCTSAGITDLRLGTTERAAAAVARDYSAALDDLRVVARKIAGTITIPDEGPEGTLTAFRQLEAHLPTSGRRLPLTLLLIDRDGKAAAWVGEGLRHELRDSTIIGEGVAAIAGFTAVTLYTVEPLEPGRRSWRLVAGRSYSTAELPFGGVTFDAAAGLPAWTVAAGSEPSPAWLDLEVDGGPTLRIRRGQPSARPPGWLRFGLWLVLASGTLGSGIARGIAALEQTSTRRAIADLVPFVVVAIAGLGHGLGSDPWALALLIAAGLALAAATRSAISTPTVDSPVWRLAIAGSGALAAAVSAILAQRFLGPLELTEPSLFGATGWMVRIAAFAFVTGGLVGGRTGDRLRERWYWLGLLGAALAVVLTGTAAPGWAASPALGWAASPAMGWALAAAAAGCFGWWGGGRRGLAGYASAVVAGAALAATIWALVQASEFRSPESRRAGTRHALTSDPTTLGDQIHDRLGSIDLDELALGDPDRLDERGDLALALWNASALPQGRSSAVWVRPDRGVVSRFSFGLPIDDDGELASHDQRWPGGRSLSGPRPSAGRAPLLAGGQHWGEARYWWQPPAAQGGESASGRGSAGLARELLRGGPGARDPGRLREVASDDGSIAIPIPAGSPLEALAGAGLHAVSLILGVLTLVLISLPWVLWSDSLRTRLARFLSSYSRKLVVVFTLLLLLPIGLLNLFLFRAIGEQLGEEQRANGEAALVSAARIIEDYMSALDPGFSIEAEFDDELMSWLSRVVSHEVNLYWGGKVYASSKPELFDTGLLPKRIPGDAYYRVGLAGQNLAARVNRTIDGASYLELYGPVALPGETGASGLFLSVPLLAQQEEAAKQLRGLGYQALIVTSLLVLFLLRVAARLATSFATPLQQLVAGTDRIARGATRLGLEPKEPELSALAEAIDDMAARVAEGRERLIREKQVVEGVVANINSAVVSVGADARVQMCNRLARELLAVEVGEPLAGRTGDPLSATLDELVRLQSPQLTRRTVRIRGAGGAEQEWTLVWVPVAGAGDPAALVVAEDVTEVLRAQRLQAWAEMARMIAHEIKNPLTPIRLSAEHLRRVYQQAPERLAEVFERCVDNILEQVVELRNTAAEFSAFSQIPRARFAPGDLVAVVRRVVDGYRAAPPADIEIRFTSSQPILQTNFDERLIGRAVRNLVENAIHASTDGGSVAVSVELVEPWVSIVVRDRGRGVAAENLHRIFEPNFSTSTSGTGLGLAITRGIVEEHGGTISAVNREDGGLEVALFLPESREATVDAQRTAPAGKG